MKYFRNFIVTVWLVLLVQPVWCHQGIDNSGLYFINFGFWLGLFHPVMGLDHLLAMLSVGILSAQIGGRALWLLPLIFVGAMILGCILAITRSGFPSLEFGIAFSVFALGGLIAADMKTKQSIAWLAVAVFAIFHGYAHGLQVPRIINPVPYILGFVTSTAVIHVLGIFVALSFNRLQRKYINLQNLGGAIAASGLILIISI